MRRGGGGKGIAGLASQSLPLTLLPMAGMQTIALLVVKMDFVLRAVLCLLIVARIQ